MASISIEVRTRAAFAAPRAAVRERMALWSLAVALAAASALIQSVQGFVGMR
jgi:hypothetical protein